jgi:hypothetical protein
MVVGEIESDMTLQEHIHLNTAMAVTGLSKRTLWRRIAQGAIACGEKDQQGKTRLRLHTVIAHANLPLNDDDIALIKRADAGEAEAQSDLGLLLLQVGRAETALYWLELAARQAYPDAMHWLGRCCIAGEGRRCDEHLGLMWLAKAAAHGHVISQYQLDWLAQNQGTVAPVDRSP